MAVRMLMPGVLMRHTLPPEYHPAFRVLNGEAGQLPGTAGVLRR